MDTQIKRIDNILYGPTIDINIDGRGLGRTIFDKMQQYEDRVLQVNAQSGEEQTYSFVNKKCVRIALEMRRRGIKENDIIMICSENSMDSILIFYSTLYLNAITVTLDPTVSFIDTVHLLKTVPPKFIFAVENAIEKLEHSLAQVDINPEIIVMGKHKNYATLSEFLMPQPDEDLFYPRYVDDIHSTGVVIMTSGTTGWQKAACASHYSLLKAWTALSFDTIDYTTALYYSTSSWISHIVFHTVGLLTGGKRIVVEKFSPQTFLMYIQEYKVTFAYLYPMYANEFNEENTRHYDSKSLLEMRIGGRFLPPEQMNNLRKCFPYTKIYAVYGLAESCSLISAFSKFSDDLASNKLRSCGVPFINTKVKVVDIETGQTLAPYQKGEICVSSDYVFSGYYNSQSRDCFDNEGFLKTCDIGMYDEDNCLYFYYRTNEVFKYQNSFIFPASVEQAIYQHPAVFETVVIGIPHETDNHHPFALIVLKDGHSTSEEELVNFVNRRVTDRCKLRAGAKIVKKLPKTCTGKIPRQVIKQMILTGNLSQFGDTNFNVKGH